LQGEKQTQSHLAPQTCSGLLKKQSQFVPGLDGAKSFLKGDYEKETANKAEENKANSKPNKPNLWVSQ